MASTEQTFMSAEDEAIYVNQTTIQAKTYRKQEGKLLGKLFSKLI